MFEKRSLQPERIDTGDYTTAEYERFLKEISFINRFTGDRRTLKKTLFREIERENLREFSVLDVGAGSGELLKTVAEFAGKTGRKAALTGLDLNEISARAIRRESIDAVRGDAFRLPFPDAAFDYAICSLFTHHLNNDEVVRVLREMQRVSRRGIFAIDLHRHRAAYALYKIFCYAFRISPLVRDDGSLSIRKSFKPGELLELANRAGILRPEVKRYPVYRIVLSSVGARYL